MKDLQFLGTSREDLMRMPEAVRSRVGHELFLVQVGREPSDFKPMQSIGAGAYEIRVRDATGAFRVMYVARFKARIYVLHAFQKKTRKTSPLDVQMAATRFATIKE